MCYRHINTRYTWLSRSNQCHCHIYLIQCCSDYYYYFGLCESLCTCAPNAFVSSKMFRVGERTGAPCYQQEYGSMSVRCVHEPAAAWVCHTSWRLVRKKPNTYAQVREQIRIPSVAEYVACDWQVWSGFSFCSCRFSLAQTLERMVLNDFWFCAFILIAQCLFLFHRHLKASGGSQMGIVRKTADKLNRSICKQYFILHAHQPRPMEQNWPLRSIRKQASECFHWLQCCH